MSLTLNFISFNFSYNLSIRHLYLSLFFLKFNRALINSRVLITLFDNDALKDNREFFVDQKDLPDVVKPLAVVADGGAIFVVVAFALGPSVDQPHN